MVLPHLKLTYFDLAARGELPRLVLTYGKIPFEDNRLSGDEWRALKPNTPLGKLPVLEIDGKTMVSQSMAISRYAAKLAGLSPESTLDALRVDMISYTLCELYEDFVDINFHTSDATQKQEKIAKLLADTIPLKFAMLSSMVQGDYFMGEQVTLADIQLFDLVHNALGKNIPGFSTAKFPKLEAVASRIQANPEIADYLAKHDK